MPTIRELVGAIRRRQGVEAAIVLGRDGLPIESQAEFGIQAEDLAAHIPSVVGAADELGAVARSGRAGTIVVEYDRGFAVISTLSDEAMLLVLLHPGADLSHLLLDLRRHRAHMASLV